MRWCETDDPPVLLERGVRLKELVPGGKVICREYERPDYAESAVGWKTFIDELDTFLG